ncbi:MAG TPA: RNA 2',3'-cyclic phosphodiesterase [Candidatus Bilamarchaeum sp.]|nr:RNA 2',3'-cyclic phosphodiesterase [Candidatus Bilamarchaeum sp.]
MRLFVAVPVPESLREKIAELGKEIQGDGVLPVKAENMHLTLKFIGEGRPDKLGEIREKLAAVRFEKFACSLRGTGVFPNESYIRVVWAGCESGGKLEELAKGVAGALKGYGEDERFTAHLTIARVKKKLDFSRFLEAHKGEDFGSFDVSEFRLIESVLGGRDGPEYRTLAVFGAEG